MKMALFDRLLKWSILLILNLSMFLGVTGAPIKGRDSSSVSCKPNWIQGPGPGGSSCFSYWPDPDHLSDSTWFQAGEECASNQSYTLQPKTKEQLDWVMKNLWETNNNAPFIPNSGIYVGLQALSGFWAWLDNSTFDTSLFCDGVEAVVRPDDTNLCGFIRNKISQQPDSGFCFDRIGCDYVSPVMSTICEDLLNIDNNLCSPGWEARPETNTSKKECYYISKPESSTIDGVTQKTSWLGAFCTCYEMKSVLADILTWEEAIWLAGNILKNEPADQHLAEVLLGLTTLNPPLSGWQWIDGTDLQNNTAHFWTYGLPAPAHYDPGHDGENNQCAAMTWVDGMIMHPRLLAFDCTSGYTRFVCKETPETQNGIFPDVVRKLHDQFFPDGCKAIK